MAGSFLTNDLEVFLNADDFAVVGVLFPVADETSAYEISGIFDDETVEVEDERRQMMVRSVRFQTKTSHGVEYGDTIIIEKIKYRVAVSQDDGTGITTLHLELIDEGS
jgi:hypothetical protein